MYFTPIRYLRPLAWMCKHKKHSTLVQPFSRRKIRMCINCCQWVTKRRGLFNKTQADDVSEECVGRIILLYLLPTRNMHERHFVNTFIHLIFGISILSQWKTPFNSMQFATPDSRGMVRYESPCRARAAEPELPSQKFNFEFFPEQWHMNLYLWCYIVASTECNNRHVHKCYHNSPHDSEFMDIFGRVNGMKATAVNLGYFTEWSIVFIRLNCS